MAVQIERNKQLIDIALRLRTVQIENNDFREIIRRYDAEYTFFYCDPPYLDIPKRLYRKGFTMKDHKNLAKMLNEIQGKAAVSYYAHPFVKKAYKGWRVVKKTQIAHSSGITLENPMPFRTRRTELLLMNY